MTRSITVIGSANADYVIHADRMPQAGETLRGYDFCVNAGGKGLNQAVAVAKLGGDVSFLGMVGADDGGRMLCRALADSGVHFAGHSVDHATTGVAMITVAENDNTIVLHAGANALLTPSVIEQRAALIEHSDYCVMQLEIPLPTVEAVCRIAAQHQTKIVLNPAPYQALPPHVIEAVDWLIPNEHEAALLVGFPVDSVSAAERAVKTLLEAGAKGVVITLGERGCVYSDGDTVVHHPACPTVVVDTTSAGDCFIGAFVTKLAQGVSVSQAVAFATKAAALTVSRAGAACSIPDAGEIT